MKRLSYTCILALILLFSFSKSSAQSDVIGNPIKIGNIEVAQYDFRKIPWVDANNSCMSLGEGWRLPTIDELKILYQNRERIGNFKWDSYWSSTKGNIVIAWRLNFGDGMVYDRDNTDNTACVRAVKTISNKVENSQESPLKKVENSNSNTNSDSKTYLIDDKNTCKIDGIFITPNGYSYYEGECKNNKANGKGRIYYKGGNYISAVFKDNKIDESYSVEVNTSDVIYVGAMQAAELDGPFQILHKESMNIDEVHFDNGSKSRNYKLTAPIVKNVEKLNLNQKKEFVYEKGPNSYFIPNTAQVLTIDWDFITIYNFNNNKLIGKYPFKLSMPGLSYDVKILGNVNDSSILFEVYYNKETSVGKVIAGTKKYILYLKQGNKILVSENPKDIIESAEFKFKKKYKLDEEKRNGSFVKNKALQTLDKKYTYFSTLATNYSTYRSSDFAPDTIFKYNDKDEVESKIVFSNSHITDFNIDEKRNKILIAYQTEDSIKLTYYNLADFKFINNILAIKNNKNYNENTYFTELEIFDDFLFFQRNGNNLETLIFYNDKFHYGFQGKIFAFSKDHNVVIAGDRTLTAYDLTKRNLIWRTPNATKSLIDPSSYNFFYRKIDDYLVLITNNIYYKIQIPDKLVSIPLYRYFDEFETKTRGNIWEEGKYEKLNDEFVYKEGYWYTSYENFNTESIKIGKLEVAKKDLGMFSVEDAVYSLDKVGNGWRLPTKDELTILYQNRKVIGGFNNAYYYSSTEKDKNYWAKNFADGYMYLVSTEQNIRPVRDLDFGKAKKSINQVNKIVPSGIIDGLSQQDLLNLIIQSELGGGSSNLDPSSDFYSKPSSSKNRNNSSSSNSNSNQSSNSIKSGGTNNQATKTMKKEVDLSYEVLSQIVSCKFCSSSVTVKMNVPRSDEFKKSFNQIGGITSSICGKCHKSSSFTYEMKAGKFVKIN